jgi:predicted small secreted protein
MPIAGGAQHLQRLARVATRTAPAEARLQQSLVQCQVPQLSQTAEGIKVTEALIFSLLLSTCNTFTTVGRSQTSFGHQGRY